MSADPLRDDIVPTQPGGRQLVQDVPHPENPCRTERATITIAEHREPTRISIETSTRTWTFVADQETAQRVTGDPVPDWMAHLGLKEVET